MKNIPKAKKVKNNFKVHNKELKDEYSWIRDENWPNKTPKKSIMSYLNQENDYFKSFFESYRKLHSEIFEELKERIKQNDQSCYIKRGEYYYYSRVEKGKEFPIFCRKKHSVKNEEVIILDVNLIAKGKEFTNIGGLSISPDHSLAAYSVDHKGSEKFTIKVLDIKKGKCIESIDNTIGPIIWHEKKIGFFYTPVDREWRQLKVFFRLIGNEEDKLIFEEKNRLYHVLISKSSDKKFIFIDSIGHESNEIYFANIQNLQPNPVKLIARQEQIRYESDCSDNIFYTRIKDKGSGDFVITKKKLLKDGTFEKSKILIDKEDNRCIKNFGLTKDYILLNYSCTSSGLYEHEVVDLKTLKKKSIKFSTEAYSSNIYSTNYEENDIRIDYSSFIEPIITYEYSFKSHKIKKIKEKKLCKKDSEKEYEIKRIYVRNEGVKIPVSLFYEKKSDGKKNRKLYLYGYGAYGHSISPTYSSFSISLVKKGFIYAIAHIRGGSDLGEVWYESAKFLKKKNTFEDFIKVSKYLIKENYVTEGNIIASGSSAGGMLIGNIINQVPNLFKAVVTHVPFVDVLNTMLDESLPLTTGEFKEWGNPKEIEYFEYILSYSPYENIKKQKYPSIFATSGLNDLRVGYWEAAKWVAKIRDNNINDKSVILLRTNMKQGHSGSSGRFNNLKEIAYELVFATTI